MFGIESPLVGFNRSPAVVVAVSRAGGLGVLGASGYTPEQLDAQMTWIEEQLDGRPYGVDQLVPGSSGGSTDPSPGGGGGEGGDLVATLRAQIPADHLDFVEGL